VEDFRYADDGGGGGGVGNRVTYDAGVGAAREQGEKALQRSLCE